MVRVSVHFVFLITESVNGSDMQLQLDPLIVTE